MHRQIGEVGAVGDILNHLGIAASVAEDWAAAVKLFAESVELFRSIDDKVGLALPLGMLSWLEEDLDRAVSLAGESLAMAHETGNRRVTMVALVGLARVAYRRADYPRAAARFQECLTLAQELGTRREIGQAIEGAMWLASALGLSRVAARLGGAAEAVRASIPAPLGFHQKVEHAQAEKALRRNLDADSCAAAWAHGRKLPLHLAIGAASEVLTAIAARLLTHSYVSRCRIRPTSPARQSTSHSTRAISVKRDSTWSWSPMTQTEVIQNVATGQVQFGMSLPNPSLFNALERGIAVKIVASAIVNQEADRPAVFMVRRDLIDGGNYTSPRDLKGATIAANADASQFYVERVLGQGGLTWADVTFVNIPQLPDVVAALATRAIDAAWLPEPFATSAERQGLAKTVATTGQLFPGASTQTLIMAPTLAETQPEVAQHFVLAYLRGLRMYYHAMNKADTDRAPMIQALVNHTPIKDPDLYTVMGLPGMDPNASLDLTSWSVFQDYFVERGFQKQKVDVTPYIDTSMLDGALERLGRDPG